MKPKETVNYGVVVVRSLQWPGAYTFYSQGRYTQIYVGNGHKYETETYYPVHPPKIMEDPYEFDEQPEPTPLFEEAQPVQNEGEGEGAEGEGAQEDY